MYQGLLCKVLTVNGKGGAPMPPMAQGEYPCGLPRQPFEVLAEVVDGHVDLVGGEAFAGHDLVGGEFVGEIQEKAPFALVLEFAEIVLDSVVADKFVVHGIVGGGECVSAARHFLEITRDTEPLGPRVDRVENGPLGDSPSPGVQSTLFGIERGPLGPHFRDHVGGNVVDVLRGEHAAVVLTDKTGDHLGRERPALGWIERGGRIFSHWQCVVNHMVKFYLGRLMDTQAGFGLGAEEDPATCVAVQVGIGVG